MTAPPELEPSPDDRATRFPEFAAMVLAAGFGTRLRPLTDERPKPLVPLGDVPLLIRILRDLARSGTSSIVVNVHHQADKISRELGLFDLDVHVVHEPVIRGTAGGIAGARAHFGGRPVMVVNGDIVGRLPLDELFASGANGLVLALAPRPLGAGTVGIDDRGRVVRLRGEVFGIETRSGDYTGMALLDDASVRALPSEGCLIGDFALPLLRGGGVIETVFARSEFEDIGTPEAYLAANLRWLDERNNEVPTRKFEKSSSFIGLDARIASTVELERSVVGAGARVVGSGLVRDSVIWPGAVAEAPLDGVVVTPGGLVVPCR